MATETKRKTPYQRIMAASLKGVGVRLSALEVFHMSLDEAISALAENDDLAEGGEGQA